MPASLSTRALGLLAGLALAWGASPACEAAAAKSAGAAVPPVIPRFSPEGGVFPEPTPVSLSVGSTSAVVRFTVDGSDPTAKSAVSKSPLRLGGSMILKARAYLGAEPAGPIVSQTYTLLDRSIADFQSHLPLVILSTFGEEVDAVTKTAASVRFIEAGSNRVSLLAPADFDGRGQIHFRGNTSLRYLKRSFALKTRDDAGAARNVSILGLPKDSDWVLYAPYPDKTLIRDVLAYGLSRQMGHYATRTRFVELFLNESGGRLARRHYQGVYVLEEKIKRDRNRVNIQKLEAEANAEPQITGGYIFKKDHWPRREEVVPTLEGNPGGFGPPSSARHGYPTGPGGFPGDPAGFLPARGGTRSGRRAEEPGPAPEISPPWGGALPFLFDQFRPSFSRGNPSGPAGAGEGVFYTARHTEFFQVEPKPDEITPAQKAWLKQHLNEFEAVLYGSQFKDPVHGYAGYIDVASFIDHHLLVEATKNIDGFRFSTYYHKDRGGKLKMDPIWDWNLSFGNANGKQGWMPEHWYWPQLDDNQYSWFRRLFEDPDFGQRYVDRWAELRGTVFSTSNVLGRIDALVAELGDARVRNFERWPILGRSIWPNRFVGQTYEDEIRFLKTFVRKRLAWMEAQFLPAPRVAAVTVDGADEITLSLSAGAGRIYYSVDGTDPRAPGGQLSESARPYASPFRIPGQGRLVARTQLEGRWSAPTLRGADR